MIRTILGHPVVRRVRDAVITLLGVAVTVFVVLRAIPGDQITAGLGTEAAALTPGQREALVDYYGLDKPLVGQFFSWLGNVLTGNLGVSSRSHATVVDLTLDSLPVTFELAVMSIVLALVIGIPLGMLSASKPNSLRDAAGQAVGLAGLSIPAFLLLDAARHRPRQVVPVQPERQGVRRRWSRTPGSTCSSCCCPPPCSASASPRRSCARRAPRCSRCARTTSSGWPTPRASRPAASQISHVLRNALVPIVTMAGLQFGYLLGGAVVVEQIFSVPGIGRQVLLGIQQKEYAVVQSTVLVIAVAFVVVNLATDALYRVIDPRVRRRMS